MTAAIDAIDLKSDSALGESSSHTHWQASLKLRFENRSGKNVLAKVAHRGPLRVQRAFYPEGDRVPHIYLLHPPGGLVAGDQLTIGVDVAEHSHGLISTPSAGRVYKNIHQHREQTQSVVANIERDAVLEWLPQENIVFAGANAANINRFNLKDHTSQLSAWDITCLGRPAGNLLFDVGVLKQKFEVWRGQEPLLLERSVFKGGSAMLEKAWGMQGYTVMGTFVLTLGEMQNAPNELADILKALKQQLQQENTQYRFALTERKGLIVARYLGHSAIQAREIFTDVWRATRLPQVGLVACPPRIWFT